ncbi:Mynd domain-containing protein [Lasiodiplodia theobromae]|uniref:MYND-type domain-containing protein n=1 Tax=Lasiodiplodia theobromae TaxID=45133 RepID=A0A5N5DP44_9PEZI|nr:Mynd domain-containing protein [Lasiodiplodia theobromae]KAB2579695.1 putative protein MSS51-like protein [Lasiodiplodia theobromae]KAF4542965.1 Mynd domain-containing protein [Lasiodiplodia theobromae]
MNNGTDPVPMDIDNAPEPSTRACHKCHIAEAALSRPLSHCSKCKTTLYCSRACQRADWKAHKKVCRDETNSSNGDNANTNNGVDVARDTSAAAVDPSLLDPETLPSTFLKAYLLRLYDEHRFFDDDRDRRNRPPVDTLLSSHGNPLRDYRRFLDRAEAAAGAGALALPWWYWVPAGGGKSGGKSGSSKGSSGGGGGGGGSDGGISAVRQACEDLAKHGGRDVENSTVVASLFDSKSDITSGDVVLEEEETLKTLRELAAKICGTTVVNSDEECE